MTDPGTPPAKNGSSAMVSLLNQMNLPTLIAVVFFGGGNWLKTAEDGRLTRDEAQHVIRQINDLHESLELFERRQKEMLQKGSDTLDNQNQLLKNQSMMIANQQKFLNQLGKIPP